MAEHTKGRASINFEETSNFTELSKHSNLSPDELKRQFYERGERYWRSGAPTLATMLGGLDFISAADADNSRKFIRKLKKEKLLNIQEPSVACDCACGIGRVTRDVLLKFFDKVDLVEMAPEFLAAAPGFIFGEANDTNKKTPATDVEQLSNTSSEATADQSTADDEISAIDEATRDSGAEPESGTEQSSTVTNDGNAETYNRVDRLICSPLQQVQLEPGRYDVVWLQWAAGQIEDSDLVAFFKRSVAAIKPGGVVVVKDNVVESSKVEYDEQDASYMRPLSLWQSLLADAGVHLLRCERVRIYPKSWHPVYYFVFRARDK